MVGMKENAKTKEARRILAMPAMAKYLGDELSPGGGTVGDDRIEAYVRQAATTTYHPVGTCKMGPSNDAMAVVDAQLRVHGIEGLRVADASIMPNIIFPAAPGRDETTRCGAPGAGVQASSVKPS